MQTTDYATQRPWSDNFLQQDKKILAFVFGCEESLIDITTPMVDMQRAADLVIQSEDDSERGVYVAVRTRTAAYVDKYPNEFTIRAQYTEGYKTEYAKIMEGYGDIMLYGFVVDNIITRWLLLDLDIFRKEAQNEYVQMEHKQNRDGRNSFYAYDITTFNLDDNGYPDIAISWSEGYFGERS